MEAIHQICVPEIATDDAYVCLWCPVALLKDAIDVMEAWGLRLQDARGVGEG
jgi:hypothetical protein